MKKRLIIILTVFLVAGLLPGVAFATSFETLPTWPTFFDSLNLSLICEVL